MINKEEITELIQGEFGIDNYHHVQNFITLKLLPVIIPKVIESVLPEKRESTKLPRGYEDRNNIEVEAFDQCIKQIKQKAKELYGVEV